MKTYIKTENIKYFQRKRHKIVYKVLVPPETVKIPMHCKGKVSEYTA